MKFLKMLKKSLKKVMKFNCLFTNFLQFSDFMGSFYHQLQAFLEGYKATKNWEKSLKVIKTWLNFEVLEEDEPCIQYGRKRTVDIIFKQYSI